jgi:histone deacetylase HOS3
MLSPDDPALAEHRSPSPAAVSSVSSYATASETERRDTTPSLVDAFDTLKLAPSSPRLPHQIPLPPELPPSQVQLILQEACTLHRYLRSSETSTIVERPERLRAIKVGAAGAWAKLASSSTDIENQLGALADSIEPGVVVHGPPFDIVRSTASLSLLSRAVAFIHSTPNEAPVTPPASPSDQQQPPYPIQLLSWIADSVPVDGRSEVPAHLPQGDLYLCPETQLAVEGGLGAIAEAIDSRQGKKVVAVRPPGHVKTFFLSADGPRALIRCRQHCGEASPSGFCLLNNVMVGVGHGK